MQQLPSSLLLLLLVALLSQSFTTTTTMIHAFTVVVPSSPRFFSSSSILFARTGGGGGRSRYQPRQAPVDRPPMNMEVPDVDELRVVTPSAKGGKDEPLGVMSRSEALSKAKEMGDLDLVLVNPSSSPPVCKIVDYSKYRYNQEKKAKEVKKNSKSSELKEVKMSYKIDVHDYSVRKKSAAKFLQQGNRVKCTVMFRGREVQHDALGFELLEKLATDLDTICLKENRPKREGRNLSLILGPKPELLKKLNENRRAQDKAKKQAKTQAKEEKAASTVTAGAAVAGASVVGALQDDDDDDDSDGLNLNGLNGSSSTSSSTSSLDELFGSDDLTDDLFG